MTKNQRVSNPVARKAEVLWMVALGAAGQLLLGWGLANAAQSAEDRET